MLKRRKRIAAIALTAASTMAIGPSSALAQTGPSIAPDLAGRTVQVIIGFGPGGGFDLWGRLVARHIGRHLPGNPTVIVQNMPGAGGFIAANHIYNIAPKDGTAIAIVASSTPLGPIRDATGARFDSTRLTWLGTPTIDTNTCVAFNSPAGEGENAQRSLPRRTGRWRDRPRRRHLRMAERPERIARHEVQGHRRLPVRLQRAAGHGARRDRRHLRHRSRQPASRLDLEQDRQRSVPGRRRIEHIAQGRSLRHRPRENPR